MSKQRYVDTRFWDDPYINTLDPSEKLLFLYLLTNPLTNICGIYEITMRRMVFDTGFNEETVKRVLARFERDGKALYKDGWLAMKNFIKHQATRSPKIQKGIELSMREVPKEIREWVNIPYNSLSHPNTNTNTNPNINSNGELFEEEELKEAEFREALESQEPIEPSEQHGDNGEYTQEFEQFWQQYPRKVNKKGSFKAWKARKKEGVEPKLLIKCCGNYSLSKKGTEEQYLMHPSTFLGPNKRYEDFKQVNIRGSTMSAEREADLKRSMGK